jgi:cytosine/adenosine deaminase-related metal-dependent hydrolase
VLIAGDRIVAVGEADQLIQLHPKAPVQNLGAVVLIPGLVNAHVHLELSDLRAGSPPAGGFGPWLLNLFQRSAGAAEKVVALVENAVREGVRQCERFGVTSVGDISRQCAVTRPLLREGPLRVTSYGEIQALAARRSLFAERIAIAADKTCESDRLRIGLTPHAPYTVEPSGYAACLAASRRDGFPLATHLAESPDEAEFLANHTGPFRELWDAIGQWDDRVPRFTGGPIRFARSLGLLDHPTLLAHVNYCDHDELNILAAGRASVVYCPRTHRYFGHPPHRWREMLRRGINVAVGTDSCASSPDLNLVDDLRLIHEIAPDFPVDELWQMATIRGAQAIGAEGSVGSLAPGKFADFAVFPAETDTPLKAVLERNLQPIGRWIAGELDKS